MGIDIGKETELVCVRVCMICFLFFALHQPCSLAHQLMFNHQTHWAMGCAKQKNARRVVRLGLLWLSSWVGVLLGLVHNWFFVFYPYAIRCPFVFRTTGPSPGQPGARRPTLDHCCRPPPHVRDGEVRQRREDVQRPFQPVNDCLNVLIVFFAF